MDIIKEKSYHPFRMQKKRKKNEIAGVRGNKIMNMFVSVLHTGL